MKIKTILGLTISSLLVTSLSAKDLVSENQSNGSYNAIDRSSESINSEFEYDAANGWWWYKQQYKDKKNKTFETKTKMTSKEKIEHEGKSKMIRIMIQQDKKLKVIKERLEYAYPNITPIYTTNEKTGEKCKTNSSTDCFIFPLQPEAQHVPVLAAWLSNPNPTNSKEWLKWEAKYFNHLTKISIGNRFAFLSEGPDAYPTNTTFVYSDNAAFPYSDKVNENRQSIIMQKVINEGKLSMLMFLGGNTLVENSLVAYKQVWHYVEKPWNKMDIIVVVPSEQAKNKILSYAKNAHYKKVSKFWEKVKIKINPKAFKKFNIIITPSIVALYKMDPTEENPKGETIWQNVLSGTTGVQTTKKALIKFLIYNDIVKPSEMATSINAATMQKNMEARKIELSEDKVYKDTNRLK